MNIDIRLKLDLFEHPKIGRLRRRLGAEAVLSLLRLWLWAAANRCDGVLRGLDAEDVEFAAQWDGASGEFFAALCQLRLLDPDEQGELWRIHDWAEHQAWASRSDERSRRARHAAQSRWGGGEKENISRDKSELCSNMPAACPSNAPRAKNREPEAFPLVQPVEARPAPARASEAGQGRAIGEGISLSGGAAGEGGAEREGAAGLRGGQSGEGVPLAAGRADPASGVFPVPHASPAKPAGGAAGRAGLRVGQSGEGVPLAAGRADPASGVFPVPHAAFVPHAAPVPHAASVPHADSEIAACPAVGVPHASPAKPAPAKPALAEPAASPAMPGAKSGFRPPTFAEVELYCAQRGGGVDARRFMDWCEARQWRVGGALLRDWRALLRRWERHERPPARPARAPAGFTERAGQAAPPALPHSPLDIPPGASPDSRADPHAAFAAPRAPELLPPEIPPRQARTAPARFVPPARTAPIALPDFPPDVSLVLSPARTAPPDVAPGPRTAPRPYPPPALGFAGLRAASVHQALVRERDLIARMILNEDRSLHARFAGDPQTAGKAQPALPPEWADGR